MTRLNSYISDITKMPKLSEWHIYGNEQQGRFVTRKPKNEIYYLSNLTTDVINKSNNSSKSSKNHQPIKKEETND